MPMNKDMIAQGISGMWNTSRHYPISLVAIRFKCPINC